MKHVVRIQYLQQPWLNERDIYMLSTMLAAVSRENTGTILLKVELFKKLIL